MSPLDALPRPPAWTEQALCAQIDGDMFYPDDGARRPDIKRICGGCPVRAQCLTAAMANKEEHGIWGGLTPRERRKQAKHERDLAHESHTPRQVATSPHHRQKGTS
jgi:WhiB family redox-sensing transcriptional regulator